MSPSNTGIAAVDWKYWTTPVKAKEVLKVHLPDMNYVIDKYKIATYLVCGNKLLYVPDVERAARQIAEMRAEREAKRLASAETN